jgi:hypothetical protein
MNVAHWAGVVASCPSFIVSTLGARFGNQTSYQFFDANSVFGTPLGGRRTVPIRIPSPSIRSLPSLKTRTTMLASCLERPNDQRKLLAEGDGQKASIFIIVGRQ